MNIKFKKFYRVQGGIFPNRSRKLILENEEKLVSGGAKSIFISDEKHFNYFIKKRFDVQNLEDLPQDISDFGIEIVEMYLPLWFDEFLKYNAVWQQGAKGSPFPKLVDDKTPGECYEISRPWVKLLQEACLKVKVTNLNTKFDLLNFLTSPEVVISEFKKHKSDELKKWMFDHKSLFYKNNFEQLKQEVENHFEILNSDEKSM